jgi:protein TonB
MKNTYLAIAFALSVLVGLPSNSGAKTYDAGTEESSTFVEAQVVSNPAPVIPEAMHENCFKSCCIARFMIGADGKSKVKLLSSSGSDEIDDITVQTLRQWKFKPAMLDGKPVASTRRIKVEFEID